MSRISLQTINKALTAMGAKEELAKGKGYFYFCGGDSFRWKETMVCASSLNQLTLEQWLSEYRSLKSSIPAHSEDITTHSAYQRGPDSTKYDARCGVWFPKQVSDDLGKVTCKSCLNMADLDVKKFGHVLKSYSDTP